MLEDLDVEQPEVIADILACCIEGGGDEKSFYRR